MRIIAATFTITLQPSGNSFEVTEDDIILDAALANGIRMPYGCRGGTCKSCRAKVVSGTVDVGRIFPAPSFLLRRRQFDGFTLMCRASAASDLVIEADEQAALPVPRLIAAAVEQIDFVSRDVAILRLRLDMADALIFAAGQYVDFLLPDGVRRSYSLANPPKSSGVDELEFHIRHMPGGLFTDRVFTGLSHGTPIQLEAPLGSFYLRETPHPAILVASGTGYAPIRSILLDLLPRARGRSVTLYWGGRRRADLYSLHEAEQLAEDYADLTIVPVLSDAGTNDGWTGRTGFVHRAVMEDFPDLSAHQVYACGTPLMVEAARRDFTAHCALPPDAFFADSFVSQADLVAAD